MSRFVLQRSCLRLTLFFILTILTDLPATNIQRARDHGIPDFNTCLRVTSLHKLHFYQLWWHCQLIVIIFSLFHRHTIFRHMKASRLWQVTGMMCPSLKISKNCTIIALIIWILTSVHCLNVQLASFSHTANFWERDWISNKTIKQLRCQTPVSDRWCTPCLKNR